MSRSSAREDAPGSEGGPGLLEGDHKTANLVFRRFLRHPIDDVWAALTDPKQLEVWFMVKVTRGPGPGAALEMEHPNGIHATGRVLEWQPPRTYEYEWNLPPSPQRPDGESSVVRWELAPAEGGTVLVLSHRRLTRPMAGVFLRGLPVFLDRLSARLDGTPLPDPPWVPRPSGSTRAP